MSILAPITRTLGLGTLGLAAAAALAPHSLAVGDGFTCGIQVQSISIDVDAKCFPGKALANIDVLFQYLRDPDETGTINWQVCIWEKDAISADDLVACKSGSKPPIGQGGAPLETIRPDIFFLELCPLIEEDEDGDDCVELYVTLQIFTTKPTGDGNVFCDDHIFFWSTEEKCFQVCCELCEPMAIDLLAMGAAQVGSSVVVSWTTASETDNVGFRVTRSGNANGPWMPIHAGLIPAQGSPTQGAEYSIVDGNPNPKRGFFYRLEDVDIFGKVTAHQPVAVENWVNIRFWLLASLF